MKRIKFTDGCPNNCAYCYEPKEMKYYDPILPDDDLQILDMNFLANPNHKKIINELSKIRGTKELVCGFDYRLLTQEIAEQFKYANFIKLRWAWDYGFGQQRMHKKVLQTLVKAGYRPEYLSVFVLVNWKIPYADCVKKLDLLKVWNVKVNDCCYDGGYKQVFQQKRLWDLEDIRRFRKMCRKHNQLVSFKIDPEYK